VAPEVEAVAHQVHYDARHAFATGVHSYASAQAIGYNAFGEINSILIPANG
jgi:hypothetical protein